MKQGCMGDNMNSDELFARHKTNYKIKEKDCVEMKISRCNYGEVKFRKDNVIYELR